MEKEQLVAPDPMLTLYTRQWLYPLLLALFFLLLLTACGTPTPTPFPSGGTEVAGTAPPTASATPVPLTTYRNDAGLFALDLPTTWEVERRGLTPLGEHYQLGPAPLGPGPASSSLFVVPADELGAEEAAEMLLCGSGCVEEIVLEETTVAGRPALRTALTSAGATLEWFFVEYEDRLIFFTLHDPDTLLTRTDLLDTVTFLDPEAVASAEGTPTATATATLEVPATARATATPVATATPRTTATPTITATATITASTSGWASWQVVEVDDAGLAFEIPEGWNLQTATVRREWGAVQGSAARLGFHWRPLAPDQELALLLPAAGEIVASEPLTLSWDEVLSAAFTRAVSVTLSSEAGWEQHALFQVGLRAYDLYIIGPERGSLAVLQPALAQALASLEFEEVQLAFEDPTAAAISWFQGLIEDPTGTSARAYMTPALRAEVPPEASPVNLLALPDRLVVYDLTWRSATEREAVVEAALTLLDESVVRRQLTLVRDPLAGWQVSAVVPIPESS